MEGSGTVTGSILFPPPFNYSSQEVEDTTTVWAVTTSLKNVFAMFHCLSWLFQVAFFSASQLIYLLSPLHSNHKAIKEKNQMFYHFLWNGKGDKIKDHSCDQWILVWSLKRIDLCSFNKSLKTTCLEWKSVWTCTTNNGEWKLLFDLELEWPLHSQCFWH